MGAGRFVAPLALFAVACNAITGVADLRADDEATDGGEAVFVVDGGREEPAPPEDEDAGRDAASTDDASAIADADADASDAPETSTTPTAKRVFVSSTVYDGDLGGLAGADAKCNALAQAAGLKGTFVAWLSVAGANARDRVSGAGPWLLVGTSSVAVTRAQLTDPPIERPISRTEAGDTATGLVWTGTSPNGVHAGDTCDAWRRGALGGGATGDARTASAAWTAATTSACASSRRLYCFQL
ncbi:MAG: hypothetical protein KIS78_17070 [Labilithrix sp.]|nr:hypothetical protein [Labilithrix sp.]